MNILSKTKIKSGLQCPKKFYYEQFHPELADMEIKAQQQKFFDSGYEIELIAKSMFDNGISIHVEGESNAFKEKQTQEKIKLNVPLFEATFCYNGVYIQIDILEPVLHDGVLSYNVIEVKSSTSLKEDHKLDLAIQAYVLNKLGLPINTLNIWHVNNLYTIENGKDFFIKENLSLLHLMRYFQNIEEKIVELQRMKEIPQSKIGCHCTSPYECPFQLQCFAKIEAKKTIFNIPRFNKKWDAYSNGILEVNEENSNKLINEYNADPKIIKAMISGKPYVAVDVLSSFINSLKFNVISFDVETIQYAFPKFKNARPYQQIPFEYSIYILDKNGKTNKKHFLHQNEEDPRPYFIKSLLEDLPQKGTILSWNKTFERMILSQLAKEFPEFADELSAIMDRIVDPLPVIRNSLYYAEFGSSYSLKSVTPAFLGEQFDYKNKAVKNGIETQDMFLKLIREKDFKVKAQIAKDMKDYCDADTYNVLLIIMQMAKIIEEREKLIA